MFDDGGRFARSALLFPSSPSLVGAVPSSGMLNSLIVTAVVFLLELELLDQLGRYGLQDYSKPEQWLTTAECLLARRCCYFLSSASLAGGISSSLVLNSLVVDLKSDSATVVLNFLLKFEQFHNFFTFSR